MNHAYSRISQLICILIAVASLLVSPSAQASSVREVSLDEMLAGAELVFHGRVLEVGSRVSADSRAIHSDVLFEVVEVLKGSYSDALLTLTFLGGTAGGRTLKVGDVRMPEPGESGIYFVESLNGEQVNPLYGWTQGQLLVIEAGDGVERVLSARGQSITAVEWDAEPGSRRLSKGVARGLLTREAAGLQQAITLESFKEQLRQRLPAGIR